MNLFIFGVKGWPVRIAAVTINLPSSRVSDPHHFNADPDQAFCFNADPDPAFHFIVDPNPYPDPAPHQGDANLRPLAYRPSRSLFWASTPLFWTSTPLFWTSTALQGSILSLESLWIFTLTRIRIQLFTLLRIRIQFWAFKSNADPDTDPKPCLWQYVLYHIMLLSKTFYRRSWQVHSFREPGSGFIQIARVTLGGAARYNTEYI